MTNVERGKKGFVTVDARTRFDAKVDRSGGPEVCWPWRGHADDRGRGEFWLEGRQHKAPRIAWSLHHGKKFPDGLLACHSCDNPNCVNPVHIFLGTQSDNIRDAVEKRRHKPNPHTSGWQKNKTECKHGHPFTPENTYINGKSGRGCRICQRTCNARWRAKRRAAVTAG